MLVTSVPFTRLSSSASFRWMETAKEAAARKQRERRARIQEQILESPRHCRCLTCGKVRTGQVSGCEACQAARTRNRKKKLAAGLWGNCSKARPSTAGVYCPACIQTRVTANGRRRETNKRAGLCACGRTIQDPSFVTCAACRMYVQRWRAQRVIAPKVIPIPALAP